MKQNKKLQSRREFFKEASEKALPILGMALFASTPILNSCTKDSTPSECNGCSNNCEGNSTSSGCSSCSNGCENSSTNSGCTSCSSGCDSGCTNDCSINCSNNANNSTNDTISEASGSVDGHEYVDLGLSVKWARCNIEASLPQIKGYYGGCAFDNVTDTVERIQFLYSLGFYSTDSYRKYEAAGIPEFDVATEKWGNNWTTPSRTQWQELIDNCDFEAYELEGVSGVRVTSKNNGKSIFLPLPGKYNNGSFSNIGSRAYYQSSTIRSKYEDASPIAIYISKKTSNEISIGGHDLTYSSAPFYRAVNTGSGGGPTNCNGNCTNTAQNSCSSCQVGCSTGCSQQCASNCSTGCKTNCTGSCINGCNTLCGGSCYYSCGGTCSYVSSGSSCTSGTCATTCRNYCFRTCSLACSQSCMSCCITTSK